MLPAPISAIFLRDIGGASVLSAAGQVWIASRWWRASRPRGGLAPGEHGVRVRRGRGGLQPLSRAAFQLSLQIIRNSDNVALKARTIASARGMARRWFTRRHEEGFFRVRAVRLTGEMCGRGRRRRENGIFVSSCEPPDIRGQDIRAGHTGTVYLFLRGAWANWANASEKIGILSPILGILSPILDSTVAIESISQPRRPGLDPGQGFSSPARRQK